MQKILMIPEYPSCTHINNACYGIVAGNMDGALDWENLRCINICFRRDCLLVFEEDRLGLRCKGATPFVLKQQVAFDKFESLIDNKELAIKYIEQCILDGKYIYSNFQMYYVPGLPAYRNWNFVHDFLIYGFDSEARIFYIQTYIDAHFGSLGVKYEDLLYAINAQTTELQGRYFAECTPVRETYQLSLNDILPVFLQYLYNENDATFSRSINMGIYDVLYSLLTYTKKRFLDLRHYTLLLEQKMCISYIMNRIIELCPQYDFAEEYGIIEDNVRSSKILLNMVIRLKMLNEDNIRGRCLLRLKEIQTKERLALENLVDKLISYLGEV